MDDSADKIKLLRVRQLVTIYNTVVYGSASHHTAKAGNMLSRDSALFESDM